MLHTYYYNTITYWFEGNPVHLQVLTRFKYPKFGEILHKRSQAKNKISNLNFLKLYVFSYILTNFTQKDHNTVELLDTLA